MSNSRNVCLVLFAFFSLVFAAGCNLPRSRPVTPIPKPKLGSLETRRH